TRLFYENWDDAAYQRYMRLFELDENKTPSELSEGMKVKLNLVLALSHGAKLLILDEPTSGLDPVSRDELLEVFKILAAEGTAILFSTHSDDILHHNYLYTRSQEAVNRIHGGLYQRVPGTGLRFQS
ncbi:MAG: AAA family ATPase, partial [Lachnospiraceae bacterium]|nr:AAA family ATPase [Lachnospiraceae bacterium]